jgi:isoamylase
VLVEGLRARQLYSYKVRGEYRPERGLRFNDVKLLLDPYAKAVTGKFRNVDNLLLACDPQSVAADLSPIPGAILLSCQRLLSLTMPSIGRALI